MEGGKKDKVFPTKRELKTEYVSQDPAFTVIVDMFNFRKLYMHT